MVVGKQSSTSPSFSVLDATVAQSSWESFSGLKETQKQTLPHKQTFEAAKMFSFYPLCGHYNAKQH